jgi:hypothetical protein
VWVAAAAAAVPTFAIEFTVLVAEFPPLLTQITITSVIDVLDWEI